MQESKRGRWSSDLFLVLAGKNGIDSGRAKQRKTLEKKYQKKGQGRWRGATILRHGVEELGPQKGELVIETQGTITNREHALKGPYWLRVACSMEAGDEEG